MHKPMTIELGPEARFLDYLEQGKFMLQRHRSKGEYVFYPRALHTIGSLDDFEWVEASGAGVIYSCTRVRRPLERGGDYTIVLVDLVEGPRMLSRLIEVDPDQVSIGMSVRAKIVTRSWSAHGSNRLAIAFVPGLASKEGQS